MKVLDLLTYERIPDLTVVISKFEDRVSIARWFLASEEALKNTLERLWGSHKTFNSSTDWKICHRLMEVQFAEAEHY